MLKFWNYFKKSESSLFLVLDSKYGFDHDIRAKIDRKTGAISLARYREVVEKYKTEFEDKLKDDELEGVLAHEMAHIKNYDIMVFLLKPRIYYTIIFCKYNELYATLFVLFDFIDSSGFIVYYI